MLRFLVFLCTFADKMEHIQITAVVLMTLLTLKLILLPANVAVYPAMNKSRWLITFGTALLAVHFLLQFVLGLRTRVVLHSILLNLSLFIPCSYAFSLAIILLQRQGRIRKIEKHLGWVIWGMSMALLVFTWAFDGKPLLGDSPEKYYAEIVVAAFFCIMQLYYFWRHVIYMKAMRITLQNYFDWNMDDQLKWIQFSIYILASVGLTVPFVIFGAGKWLAFYSLFFFACIFYFVDSFCIYVQSTIPQRLQEAGESERKEQSEEGRNVDQRIDPIAINRVERAVEKWLKSGGYLQGGMKMPNAAAGMGVPQYLLSGWLRQKGLKYSEWMTDLRVSEAKRILKEHPDWSNETVAIHCGFNDRSYFQTIFKKSTGMTPAEFIQTTH